ncbi:hypothetical protein BC834DRAFT_819785 [Gloeopeniophorella convolvens]|nr:hypothetical protein BC834DRAFT_819785 [Gloeopeniophorella convolvens]
MTSSREKQPRTFRLTINALLSLPGRLCNPPPAVGKVRSCKVTPMFKVKLDDVLNRKHLPPLGLKDFEEWLLFVEGCPENLYFILWLKEYATRYDQWLAQTRSNRSTTSSREQYRFSNQIQHSTNLTLFYLRAKQTFFTPGAEYELNIPSDILSPFHTGHFVSPHPDPIVFSQVACQVHDMLKESLDRFVLAAYYNVGTNRALCGMVGGTVIALAGSVPPLAVNFAGERDRWLRLLALPGLWLGLTILVASMHGVCMMVYVFGDLRQLHKFELARPRISAPRLLDSSSSRPPISAPLPVYQSKSASSSSFLPSYTFKRPRPVPAPQPAVQPNLTISIPPITRPPAVAVIATRERDSSAGSTASTPYDTDSQYSASTSSLAGDAAEPEITVSPAYFDPDPAPEGPATRTGPDAPPFITDGLAVPSSSYRFGTAGTHTEECRFNRACLNNATAAFIAYDDDDLYDRPASKAAEEGLRGGFDFDALPERDGGDAPCICAIAPAAPSSVALPLDSTREKRLQSDAHSLPVPVAIPTPTPQVSDDSHSSRCAELKSPAAFLGRAQYKCNRNTTVHSAASAAAPSNQHHRSWPTKPEVSPPSIENQHSRIRHVPAFGPLTRVLSPVISRAQWEIVVRSAFVAMLISVTIIGGLLAVPVQR